NVRGKGEVYRPYLARLTENHAYDSEGAVSVELSKDMKDLINSEEVLETAQRYVEQLSFTGNTQTRGLQFSNELKLNDARQTIFTHDLAYLASGIYSTVPEYGYGWTRLFGDAPEQTDEQLYRQRVLQAALSSGDETIQKALTKAGKAAYKAVKKDVEVTIDKDQQLDFQDKHATGERVNILVDREDAQAFLDVFFSKLQKANDLKDAVNEQLDTEDQFGSDETFSAFLSAMENQYKNAFRDTGISRVSFDMLVDKQNVIHAFDALVKRQDGDIIVNAMLDDDDRRGPAFHLRVGGDTLVKFNVEKKTKTAGTVDFAFGNFENSVAYNNFATADGLVYGTFEFAPMDVSWSSDLGKFGLFLQTSPNAATDGSAAGFHLLAQTGFSTLGTATIEADVRDAEYTGMVTEDDIVIHKEYKDKEKRARRLQYWLADLPESDPLYKSALRQIVQTIVDETMTAAKAAAATADETLSTGATK
ncbi:MAG: hypothetical protein IJO82_07595, partial [Clostridia bacterium]|nr:hypothetical protein [Clostridia bacterium]